MIKADMISLLYSSVALVVAIAYIPQATRLMLRQTPCNDISLLTWIMWGYTAFVSLLYSMFELADFKFSIVNGINTFFAILIIVVTLYKRHKYSEITLQQETLDEQLSEIHDDVLQIQENLENAATEK